MPQPNLTESIALPAPTDAELEGIDLYGDNFTPAEIGQWFADESEAYAEMQDSGETGRGGDEYAHLHRFHASSLLARHSKGGTLLALGPGAGDELAAFIATKNWRIIAVEASSALRLTLTQRFSKIAVLPADILGTLPLPDCSVDLFLSFGVLHHIPNVSKLLGEVERVLRPGGSAILREPASSMGDWRTRRQGCTIHERGMTPEWIRRHIATTALFFQQRPRPCLFRPWVRLARRFGLDPLSPLGVRVDAVLSRVTEWNSRYRRPRWWQRFAPGAYIYLLQKRE